MYDLNVLISQTSPSDHSGHSNAKSKMLYVHKVKQIWSYAIKQEISTDKSTVIIDYLPKWCIIYNTELSELFSW